MSDTTTRKADINDQLRSLWIKHTKAVTFHSQEAKRCAAALAALGQAVDTVVGEDVAAGPARTRRLDANTGAAARLIADHIRQHGPQRLSQLTALGLVSQPTVSRILRKGPFTKNDNTDQWSLCEVGSAPSGQTLAEAAAKT